MNISKYFWGTIFCTFIKQTCVRCGKVDREWNLQEWSGIKGMNIVTSFTCHGKCTQEHHDENTYLWNGFKPRVKGDIWDPTTEANREALGGSNGSSTKAA